jgi:hypothetical protein
VTGHAQFGCLVCITSWSPSSLGTKPLPPHVGHCCSSSVPFSTAPSPLQSGQVFMCASWDATTPPAITFASASLIHSHRASATSVRLTELRRGQGIYQCVEKVGGRSCLPLPTVNINGDYSFAWIAPEPDVKVVLFVFHPEISVPSPTAWL